MAYQTPYADIPLNTRAIANYNNPIFDVLRNGLGWLENQEQKIADRKKFELLRQIQDDAMTDKYTQAKNANEDLAKQLYGNSYFVNSDDADLAKAMEALKIRESNKMLDTLGRDIASKVNQDVYKAGNEQELLSSLGFNNRTQDELNKVKDFAQSKLTERYKPYIQGKLADREIDEGKVPEQDIDALVGEFRDKYGMDIDPSTLYDSSKRKDLRQGGINKRIGSVFKQLANKQVTPEDAINYFYLTQAMNPDNSVIIDNAIKSATDMRTRAITQGATRLVQEAVAAARQLSPKGNINYNIVRAKVLKSAAERNIPEETALQIFNTYAVKDGSLNPEYQRAKEEVNTAQKVLEDIKGRKDYQDFIAARDKVAVTADNPETKAAFEAVRQTDKSLSPSDFNNVMAYISSIGIDPSTLKNDDKGRGTISKAIAGYKAKVPGWIAAENAVKEKQLRFNAVGTTNSYFDF